MHGEAGCGLRVRGGGRGGPCVHHEVDHRQQVLVLAEILTNPPLDAIAPDGTACGADADRKTKTWMPETIQLHAHQEEGVGGAQTVAVHGIELGLCEQPSGARKAPRRLMNRCGGGGQVRPRGACGPWRDGG